MSIDHFTNRAARCPACFRRVDGATDPINDAMPKSGDLSVCGYCTTLCVFNDDLTVRAMHEHEFDALPPALRVQLALLRKAARAVLLERSTKRWEPDADPHRKPPR